MTKKKNNEKICSKCHESKKLKTEFYVASSDIIHSDGRVSICRSCLEDIVIYDDPYSVANTMRMIDRPFLKQSYDDSKENAKPFREYMRRLAMPQNRWLNYSNSVFEDVEIALPENKEKEIELDKLSSDELKSKWGMYKDGNDYMFLEKFYNEYHTNYATDTPAQRNLYKNIAKVHLQAEKELANGNIKAFKDLMDLSSKMHNDGNIKPIQSTGANDDKGLSTYGLWIQEIEKEEPCEFFEDKSTYEDADSFKKYIDKWFVRPMKNIFNITRDFDVKDDDKK